MRKELLWAGIIGIIFGVAIGFGVYRVRNKVEPDSKATPQPSSASGTGLTKIALDKPENLRVYTENPISVSGLTKSLNWVVVSSLDADDIASSMDDGTFSLDVDLDGGINFIQATSINPDGSTAFQKILVVYSSSFTLETDAGSEASGASEIENSVALKLSQSENPPRAYVGTVTDISESTVQIRSTDSQIQQISTLTESLTVVDTKGTSNKTVKLADIAIGDFIVAMGYIDGNDVLSAKRILISDALNEPKLEVSLYKVQAVNKKSIDAISVADSQNSTITPDKNTVLQSFLEGKTEKISLADISENDLIIVVADNSGSPSLIRSIFVLTAKE